MYANGPWFCSISIGFWCRGFGHGNIFIYGDKSFTQKSISSLETKSKIHKNRQKRPPERHPNDAWKGSLSAARLQKV